MTTRENKATEREKQGVERDVLALEWVFFHGRPHYFLLERFCTVVSYLTYDIIITQKSISSLFHNIHGLILF